MKLKTLLGFAAYPIIFQCIEICDPRLLECIDFLEIFGNYE